MQYLTPRPVLFTAGRRRRRHVRRLALALGVITAINGGINIAARAQLDEPTALQRLTGPAGLVPEAEPRRTQTFGVAGFPALGFELRRDGRRASIRFTCGGNGTGCDAASAGWQPLWADHAAGGDLVFRDDNGVSVLRVTPLGGMTLFGGAGFVPTAVPAGGVAALSQG